MVTRKPHKDKKKSTYLAKILKLQEQQPKVQSVYVKYSEKSMKNGETPHSCRISYSERLANRSGKHLLTMFLVSLMLSLSPQLNFMTFLPVLYSYEPVLLLFQENI